jgi:hypothetical protein
MLPLKYIADYNVLSSGTRPNIAYGSGAGSASLQHANNDEAEAGRYTHLAIIFRFLL